jgi:hypothetical protein
MAIPGVKINPGPGGHSPDYRALKTAAPSFGFGSETRGDASAKQLKQMPGPGTYAVPGVIGNDGPSKTLHASLTYSPEAKEHAKKPGPGAYDGDVLRTRKQDPQYKLGTSQRPDLASGKKGPQPAPGSYNPSTTFTQTASQRWGFGTEKRLRAADAGQAPGAGTYTLPSRLQEGPSFQMGLKLERGATTNLKNPGPG